MGARESFVEEIDRGSSRPRKKLKTGNKGARERRLDDAIPLGLNEEPSQRPKKNDRGVGLNREVRREIWQ